MPAKLLRTYQQTIKTYEVDHPTIGKNYLVNIITNDPSQHLASVSISLNGEEITDEDEREAVLSEIEKSEVEAQTSENQTPKTPSPYRRNWPPIARD